MPALLDGVAILPAAADLPAVGRREVMIGQDNMTPVFVIHADVCYINYKSIDCQCWKIEEILMNVHSMVLCLP